MEPVDYLRIFQRRWKIVAINILVAIAAGFAIVVANPPPEEPKGPIAYEATTILVSNGGTTTLSSPSTAAALVGVGDVPAAVAEEIKFDGPISDLVKNVRASADSDTGLLRIKATAPTSLEAIETANAFSDQLLFFLQKKASNIGRLSADTLRGEIADVERTISKIDSQREGAGPDEVADLTGERNAAEERLQALRDSYEQTLLSVPSVGLSVVQDASAAPVLPVGQGLQAPRGPIPRLIIAAILGLIGGLAITLILDRLDSRIHSKAEAEYHFSMPVLAEIPRIRRKPTFIGLPMVSITPFADAFRLLAAEIVRRSDTLRERQAKSMSPELLQGAMPREQDDQSLTMLITSAAPAEGKTTVVANLAVAFAEFGKRVVVISCDFQRPEIHKYFETGNQSGLGEALTSNGAAPILNGHIKRTKISNVRLVPSGGVPEHPGELLGSERMRMALAEARSNADIILIDTPPVLMSSMVTLLFSEVDAVMVVARSGRTTATLGKTMDEYLRRLHTPLLGLIFNSSRDSHHLSSYDYYGYSREERKQAEAASKETARAESLIR